MRPTGHMLSPLIVMTVLLAMCLSAGASPTLQVFIPGSISGDRVLTPPGAGLDQDSWFIGDSSFTLRLLGTPLSGNVLRYGTLIVSVPQNQTGTLTIGTLDPLVATRSAGLTTLPNGNANTDRLTNEPGNDAYTILPTHMPSPDPFVNPHFPLRNDLADFLFYDVGSFSGTSDIIYDYDAGANNFPTAPEPEGGQVKNYPVAVSGFSWVHFDLVAYLDVPPGGQDRWLMNPDDHDATFAASTAPPQPGSIPAPGALIISAVGTGLVGWLHRRRML